MDSLTQLTLGAAVGEAVLGRKVGRKAALWGAVCGTLPDLDVFVPFGDPVKDFTYHRSFSHSIFILTLLTPLIVWLILKLHPNSQHARTGWSWLVWLCLITHILLDCFTVYGTQIFWPFWNNPVGWGSVFIIDPFYTVPLLIGVLCALMMSRNHPRGLLLNKAGLTLSTLYLVWSVGAQSYVTRAVEKSFAAQMIAYENLLVSAGPLNTMLWRIVATKSNGDYYEGYYSLLDGSEKVTLTHHESEPELLDGLDQHGQVVRLRWFTKGFYKVWQNEDAVVMTDLRMGAEPSYVFSFVVGHLAPERAVIPARRLAPERDFGQLKKAWCRIWSENIRSCS